jgi:hypothetical protein
VHTPCILFSLFYFRLRVEKVIIIHNLYPVFGSDQTKMNQYNGNEFIKLYANYVEITQSLEVLVMV